MQGYHPPFRHDRDKDCKGGGVMLLIHKSFNVLDYPELNTLGFEESVWCIIQLSKTDKILTGICYFHAREFAGK